MADNEENESKEEREKDPNYNIPDHVNLNDVIFPPVNHEGLPPIPSSQTLLSPQPPENGGGNGGDEVERKWTGFACEQLRARVLRTVSEVWNYWIPRGAIRSFGCGAGVAVLVWWVYAVVRRRLMVKDHMVLLLKDKDEKIKQLLHQIAQMNQLLLSLHKNHVKEG